MHKEHEMGIANSGSVGRGKPLWPQDRVDKMISASGVGRLGGIRPSRLGSAAGSPVLSIPARVGKPIEPVGSEMTAFSGVFQRGGGERI